MKVSTLAVLAGAALAVTACGGGRAMQDWTAPIRALLSADALMFVSFDTNADLIITREEAEAGYGREWTRADADANGTLSPIEFSNWSGLVMGGAQIGPYRLDFDRNVDNVITREEFDTELRARFTQYDSDENGAVARAEFVRLVGQARQPVQRRQQIAPAIGDRGPNGN